MVSTTMLPAQAGLLILVIVGSLLYSYGKQRNVIILPRVIGAVFAGYALAQICFMISLWLNHVAFPLNLESMELTVLEHLKRALNGQVIYTDPTPEFVALAYNPLYYYLTAPFAWFLGANLFALRLVAILGMFGSGLIIFLAVRRATASKWWALMAVGFFAAAYRAMDAYLDNAHTDSWLLCTILLGCYLIELKRSRFVDLVGLLLLVIAFWFKQPGAIFAIGAVLFLTWRYGWRQAWPFWLLAIILGPVLYIVAPTWLLGPRFHFFTFEVPRQWTALNFGTLRRLASIVIKSYVLLAVLGLAVSTYSLWRLRSKSSIWFFMFPFALLSGFVGALDSESNNNVFIVMGVWFIITGVMGLKQLLDHLEVFDRWGLYLLTLGASFILLLYNPLSVITSPHADEAYQDLVTYLETLDGPVYAPWLGQLPDGYRFYPAVHWVPMTDLIRGGGVDGLASFSGDLEMQQLLGPVLYPAGNAYILMNFPLEHDPALAFLTEMYVLGSDLGDRFKPLSTLPRRYQLGWPRYLYRYAPAETAKPVLDGSEQPRN